MSFITREVAWLRKHGTITGGGWNSDTGMVHVIWSPHHNSRVITGYGINDNDIKQDLYNTIKNRLYTICNS